MTKYQKVDEFHDLIESPIFINQLEDSIKETDLNTLNDLFTKLPRTYQKTLLRLAKTMKKQSDKGIAKYGTNIDEASNNDYDWHDMAMEELADMLVYIEKGKSVQK